jgi:hypothetical protein
MPNFILTITARNINGAWDQAQQCLNATHLVRPSRAGGVWEYPAPVVTEYLQPCERVLFNAARNPNPFFHFFEALWMLAGRNDVDWIAQFNSRMREFSDDGQTFHGAYGYRWRYAFDLEGGAEDDYADQLVKIIRMLRRCPDERRAVLTMWNPIWDLERPDVKDVPCNQQVLFKIRDGRLTATVTCRSNDIVWGAYGSNAVHFSMLLEYMAGMIGVPIGTLWVLSDSWHAYTERWAGVGGNGGPPSCDLYETGEVRPYPMVTEAETWDEDLKWWMEWSETQEPCNIYQYRNSFFSAVATPLLCGWRAYKNETEADPLAEAQRHVRRCAATDWRTAAGLWLRGVQERRTQKKVQV